MKFLRLQAQMGSLFGVKVTCPVWGMMDLGCLWNTWSGEQRTELAVDINLEAVGMYGRWLALRLTQEKDRRNKLSSQPSPT